jgi:hypothetical protein
MMGYRKRGANVMIAVDFTTVLKDAPVGQWIALSNGEDRIVATALLLSDAIALAHERGEPNPVVMKVPPYGALVL